MVGQVNLLFRGARGQQVERVLHAGADLERLFFQFELAGFDFGKVENVVDDGQERIAAVADRFDQLALFGGQFRFQQQAGHGDDAVHRRADFVAHVGQKFGFRACGGFGDHAGGLQRVIGLGQLVL